MKNITEKQSILAVVAAGQSENGLWDSVYFSDETDYMSLTSKTDAVDMTVVLYDCGTKAAIYRLPLNDQNRIVTEYSAQAIEDGIMALHKRIRPHRHWTLYTNAA